MAENFDSVTGKINPCVEQTDCYQVSDLERSTHGMNGLPSWVFVEN